jgi:hypothetical protein
MARLTTERATRGHVDDPAPAARDHVPNRAPRNVRRTHEIDVQRFLPGRLPLLVGDVGDRMCRVEAGVVHHDIQPAQAVRRVVDHPAHRLRVGEVGLHSDVAAAGQLGEQLRRELGGIPVVGRYPVSVRRERADDCRADTP